MEGLVVLLIIYIIVSLIAKVTTFITATRVGHLEEMVTTLLGRRGGERACEQEESVKPAVRVEATRQAAASTSGGLAVDKKQTTESGVAFDKKHTTESGVAIGNNRTIEQSEQSNNQTPEQSEKSKNRKIEQSEQSNNLDFLEAFWAKFEDWFCVRGDFAPQGMTREFAVATRWLVRVGLVMLVASLVYFVKLSIDQGWMGPTGRVVALVLWGLAGVAGGVALVKRTRYGLIGHALAAIGTVALYFGFGLGHRFFDPPVIASAPLAFAALTAVTILAGVLSVMLPSATLAGMGLVGGYLVPVIAGQDTGAPLPLCCYLTLLNLGAYVVAQKRRWPALDALATAFAYLMVFLWCGRHPALAVSARVTLLAFLALIHAGFVSRLVMNVRAENAAQVSYRWVALILNAVVFGGWVAAQFQSLWSGRATAAICCVLALAYGALAYWGRVRRWLDEASENIVVVLAVAFLALAPMALAAQNGAWLGAAWAILAVAAAEAARVTKMGVLRGLAYVLLAASVPAILLGNDHVYSGTALTFAAYLQGLVVRAARLWICPLAVGLVGVRVGPKNALLAVAGVLAFLLLTAEAHFFGETFISVAPSAAVTLAWAAVAFAGLWAGLVKRVKPLRLASLGLLGVTVAKLLVFDTAAFVMPARVAVTAVVGLLLIVGAFLYLKFKEQFDN